MTDEHLEQMARAKHLAGEPWDTIKKDMSRIIAENLPQHDKPLSLAQVICCRARKPISQTDVLETPVIKMPAVPNPKPVKTNSKFVKRQRGSPVSLNFYFLCDRRLRYNELIVYALARKWKYQNEKRARKNKPGKPISVNRIHKATGFREAAIKTIISKLQNLEYLDKHMNPIVECRRFRKLRVGLGKDIRLQIYKGIIDTNPTPKNVRWLSMALGVERTTIFRWNAKMHPVASVGGGTPTDATPTGATQNPLRMQHTPPTGATQNPLRMQHK